MLSLRSCLLALSFVSFVAAQAAAQCSVPGGGYLTIGDALADPACATIDVDPGTYDEHLQVDRPVTIRGAGSASTFVTGGLTVVAPTSDLVLEDLYLTASMKEALGGFGLRLLDANNQRLENFTMRRCVLDGEWDPVTEANKTRVAMYKVPWAGAVVMEDNEIKNFGWWYLFDNTSSATPSADQQLTTIVMTGNHFHDVAGSGAWRGLPGVGIASALLDGNIFDHTMIDPAQSLSWAAIEVNNVLDLVATNNQVLGVPPSWGMRGDAFQFWTEAPLAWTLDVSCNEITDNVEGIRIYGTHDDPVRFSDPAGSVTSNSITGNTLYGLMAPGTLDASGNWWGAADGPSGDGPGSGDAIVGGGASFTPWSIAPASATMDLRPGNDNNQINTGARQLVPIAFLGGGGSECFATGDPCDPVDGIDPESIDVRGATPSASKTRLGDLDDDGDCDLLIYVRAREMDDPTEAECNDPGATLVVTGSLYNGQSFASSDAVNWLSCD